VANWAIQATAHTQRELNAWRRLRGGGKPIATSIGAFCSPSSRRCRSEPCNRDGRTAGTEMQSSREGLGWPARQGFVAGTFIPASALSVHDRFRAFRTSPSHARRACGQRRRATRGCGAGATRACGCPASVSRKSRTTEGRAARAREGCTPALSEPGREDTEPRQQRRPLNSVSTIRRVAAPLRIIRLWAFATDLPDVSSEFG
jgi:hypothetical protein